MGRVALAAALEQQTGLALPEGSREGWTTLGDLRRYVRGTSSDTPLVVAGERSALEAEAAERDSSPAAAARKSPASKPVEPASRHATYRYPRWPWTWPIPWVRTVFVEAVLRPLVWLLSAPQVRRRESPVSLLGPLLLVSNHRTAMDVPLLLYALPRRLRRKTAVAMAGEMLAGWQQSWSPRALPAELETHRRWWGPIAALLLQALLNVFPLPRTVGFRAGFEHAGRALDRGYSVLIFPEGRRGPGGELLPFKAGLGLLAEESYAPILPMALRLEGSQSRRGEPQIAIGTLLHVVSGASAEETVTQVRGAVEQLLEGLEPKSRSVL
jgi:long-chain acyl-CoA synthetase